MICRWFKYALVLFLGGLLVLPATAEPTITIGSWNLDWLDLTSDSRGPKRTTADYQQLAKLFTQSQMDVLGFQEVASAKAIAQVVGPQYTIELSQRAAKAWRGQWPQYTGFAIRRGIHYQRHPDLNLDVTHSGQLRDAVDITLLDANHQSYLRLLVVHLKSRCFSGSQKQAKHLSDCSRLYQQSKRLRDWVSQRHQEKVPFMILGDFNRRLTEDDDWFFPSLERGENSGSTPLILATRGHKNHCWVAYRHHSSVYLKNYAEFIDHIVYGSRAAKAVVPSSFQQISPTKLQARRYRLSDHCPLTIEYRGLNKEPREKAVVAR